MMPPRSSSVMRRFTVSTVVLDAGQFGGAGDEGRAGNAIVARGKDRLAACEAPVLADPGQLRELGFRQG